MEQARLMLLGKRTRKHSDESWEEKAFAQDVNEMLGGCVWPQRSYTCSFCKREFRSAQALGGHMNVHRRDKAKLKLFSTPINRVFGPHQNDCCNDQQIGLYTPLILNNNNHYCENHQEFCFDFQNPNLVLLSSVTYSHVAAASSDLCRDTNPSFSSTVNELQGVSKDVCQMGKKQEHKSCLTLVSKQDDEVEHEISSEVNVCSIQELDLELRLGNRPNKTCKKCFIGVERSTLDKGKFDAEWI